MDRFKLAGLAICATSVLGIGAAAYTSKAAWDLMVGRVPLVEKPVELRQIETLDSTIESLSGIKSLFWV